MGRNAYIGGSTKEIIGNRKKSIIHKIYQELHNYMLTNHISFKTLEEYFDIYEEEEVREKLEDISLNYNGRRDRFLKELTKYIHKNKLNKN